MLGMFINYVFRFDHGYRQTYVVTKTRFRRFKIKTTARMKTTQTKMTKTQKMKMTTKIKTTENVNKLGLSWAKLSSNLN